MPTLSPAAWPTLPLVHRGKVRDTFAAGDDLLMVASDRLSAFDVVLPTAIPGKGIVLTRLSVDWFGRTGEIAPNHLITADPAQFPTSLHPHADALRGRAMLVRRAERIDVECVVRGYLAGSAWQEYGATGELAGESLPSGLRRGDALPTARFTPAWKHDEGHDEPISRAVLAERVGPDLAQRLETISLTLYRFGVERSAERGLILADTKFEFGWVDGELTLIDELMTPDSSRYWDAATYRPGEEAASFDKQFVRDWLLRSGWDKQPPGPAMPEAIVAGTMERYEEVCRRLLGGPAEEGGDRANAGTAAGGETGTEAALSEQGTGVGSLWSVRVTILPKTGVNDPEGEVIGNGLRDLGYGEVRSVSAGRYFQLTIAAASRDAAEVRATEMCDRLLANPVIEAYALQVVAADADSSAGKLVQGGDAP